MWTQIRALESSSSRLYLDPKAELTPCDFISYLSNCVKPAFLRCLQFLFCVPSLASPFSARHPSPLRVPLSGSFSPALLDKASLSEWCFLHWSFLALFPVSVLTVVILVPLLCVPVLFSQGMLADESNPASTFSLLGVGRGATINFVYFPFSLWSHSNHNLPLS